MRNEFSRQLASHNVVVDHSVVARRLVEEDFGRVETGNALGVVTPSTARDVLAVVEAAHATGQRLTLRTQGSSQSGQALPAKSYVVELGGFKGVARVDVERQLVDVGTAASWRDILSLSLEHGLAPPTFPMNLDISVGGTLSAGGVGAASHVAGTCCDAVEALKVVTGSGELITCTRSIHSDLFAAVLGGIGQVGAILEATLRLKPVPAGLRLRYVRFRSLEDCIHALEAVSASGKFCFIEGYCSSGFRGLLGANGSHRPLMDWSFALKLSSDDAASPHQGEVLDLCPGGELIAEDTDAFEALITSYDQRFVQMRATGEWLEPHPWFEVFLPKERAAEFIESALRTLPPYFGDGHRLFALAKGQSRTCFGYPEQAHQHCVGFAVLPTRVSASTLPEALKVLSELHDKAIAMGAKRYLSGWQKPTDGWWRRHLGSFYETWLEAKSKYDPNGVFTSRLASELK